VCITKKQKHFEENIYKFCNMFGGDTCDRNIYVRKEGRKEGRNYKLQL
jgi:hypothetical protein